tara:strand:- start:109795 stop:111216 length:1422 start_codon:yes stop_codon:yes gene_type:complete
MSGTIEILHPRSMKHLSSVLTDLIRNKLWLKVLIGMISGLIVGVILGPSVGWLDSHAANTLGNWLALPGQLFLALVQMIVIPLIFASVIRGLAAGENLEQLKKIGIRVVAFFAGTTAIATLIGLSLGLIIKPGSYISSEMLQSTLGTSAGAAAIPKGTLQTPGLSEIPEKLITILPGNPLNSMVQGQMLQVVVFAFLVGLALVSMAPKNSKPMLDLLGSLQEVCMTVVRWAMVLAPYAVFGLLAQLTMKIGMDILLSMAVYMLTVILGLVLVFMFFLILVGISTKISPAKFMSSTKEVLLLAFSTSSSAAVMPLSIKTAEENLKVRPSISQFVIPLGATINMNGTALYQGVATIFLAQAFGVDIGFSGMVLVVVMATGASIGSPGTPGVGIIILSMVLVTVGIPPTGIALLMGVDRILDMCRTVINVAGDLVACKIMDHWVTGEKSIEEQLSDEQARDKLRQVSGEDVIISNS